MEKLFRKFFSIEMMTVGLFIFLVAIARATFIESAHGTQAARAVVYNALWFELLLTYLGVNLVVNIFRYRMFAREKIAVLFFHLAFIVILIGAGITRYASFEGMMLIREGEQSNVIYSSEGELQILAHDTQMQVEINKKLILSDISSNDFRLSFQRPDQSGKVAVEYVNFIPNAINQLETNVDDGKTILEIVTPGPMGMDTNYVEEGSLLQKEGFILAFEYADAPALAVKINKDKGGFTMSAPADVNYMLMSDQSTGVVLADSTEGFYQGRLYSMMGVNFVYKAVHRNAKLTKVKAMTKDQGQDVLYVKLTSGKESKIIELEGGQGRIPVPTFFQFDGLNYKMAYGARPVTTPFYLALRDFELLRYPGSNSPSSYASEITVIDDEKNVRFDKRIFMNSVMDYRGYRFFQSSYDTDEKGTRLSVNQDFWGTQISYLGYLLMGIGMVMSLFMYASRFRELNRMITGIHKKKSTLLSVLFAIGCSVSFAQNHDHDHHDHSHDHDHSSHATEVYNESTEDSIQQQNTTNKPELTEEEKADWERFNQTPIGIEHAKLVDVLIVQDSEGRFKPFHTVALEVLRKIHRKDTYNGLSPTQVFLDMHLNRDFWRFQPIIVVNNEAIQKKLAIKGKYASFHDFFDPITKAYLLEEAVAISNQKPAKKQNEFDKQIIKVNERVQILNLTFMYQFLRILPALNNENNTWYNPMDMNAIYLGQDSLMPRAFMTYMSALADAKKTGDYSMSDEWIGHLKSYQRAVSDSVLPSDSRVKAEVWYNKLKLFQRLSNYYLIFGLALLAIFFIRALTVKSNWTKYPNRILFGFVLVSFVLHALGLGMRWYISGHAPWSNGYEALVFIAWVTVLAGLIFSRKSMVTLGGTAILTYFMLFVAHMNQLDPEITNLVPVLQSYWLMIHVAIITGSYGFLGLGAMMSLLVLVLFILRNQENSKRLNLNINEISHIVELTTMIGLYMLAIGTFLGGVWANESWGRYWGWDPKETWALVSILVYAILLHLRFIPKLNNKLVFNVVSLWSYGAILFTFFGVNFFLVGLHSYAEGEADTMWPSWVVKTIIVFGVFTLVAIFRGVKSGRK
jgi:cytochrome c-type biogenesis protein CcsB